MDIKDDIEKIIIDKDELAAICKRLGAEISRDYDGKNLLLVSVLKGSIVFMADLMREITCHCKIDFLSVSSYSGGTKTTGVVKFKKDIDVDPQGCDILFVEDILDSGITLSYIKKFFQDRHANSIKICTLLDKPANRKADIQADYVGKIIPDGFIVGYGLDYGEQYRNLPFIGYLSPRIYDNDKK